jgi:excinuclease ABC subunit B
MDKFHLKSSFQPKGDQVSAIKTLGDGIRNNIQDQVLLGVTGSGKTFTIANVIEQVNRPALVIAPNKTLAAQLYNEFCELFPDNAVEYFVSYYDYYQPEAYVPETDTYIEKDASINDRIDRLRHSATSSVMQRRDVIIVASVSCIYALGSPSFYRDMALRIKAGTKVDFDQFLRDLVAIQYQRNDFDFLRGTFRVRGSKVEIIPSSYSDDGLRIEFFDEEIENIVTFDTLTGDKKNTFKEFMVFPASHYIASQEIIRSAVAEIREDLKLSLSEMKGQNKLLEAQRLEQRTLYDLEMIQATGYCKGIENYSRYMDKRKPGETPSVLLDYFPEDFLVFIDESHITVPQLRGMYNGDRSRKTTLVEHGFRLPSALDNRPLNFEEFRKHALRTVFVSATPGPFEIEAGKGRIAEQIIRPTGLVDPDVIIKKADGQVHDLAGEIRKRIGLKQRVLVTTLTKKMAEELTEYYQDLGFRVQYLHSDVETMERVKIIRDLRNGVYDVLVGINLLREGLDIPEVSLVAVLDADKEGFLRSETSLIQTSGRAARNVEGTVIFYCNERTRSIDNALKEMDRRREKQKEYNRKNSITPQTIVKNMSNILLSIYEKDYVTVEAEEALTLKEGWSGYEDIEKEIGKLRIKMKRYAENYQFEEAIRCREKIKELQLLEEKYT